MPSPDIRPMAAPAMRIVTVEGSDESWSRFVDSHPESTVYHSLAWRDLLEQSFGYRSWCLRAVDERSGTTTGILPLYLVSSPFGRRLVAVPFRDRGGLLWNDAAAFEALVSESKRIAAAVGAQSIVLKTVAPYPPELTTACGLAERHYWIHSVIPLAHFATEPLLQRLGPKRRGPIRQALDGGMSCVDGQTDAEAWYGLHLQTQRRLGLPPFPLTFFERLLRTLVPLGAAQLLLARRGGELMAATILLRHGPDVTYGYAASSAEGQRLAAGDVVLFTALESAIAEQRRTFDMGSDAPSQDGLLFFKKRWFAVQAAIPTYSIGSDPGAGPDSSSARYRVLRYGFRHLPAPILRLTGLATKYFG